MYIDELLKSWGTFRATKNAAHLEQANKIEPHLKKLPPSHLEAIELHYCDPRPTADKYVQMGIARDRYFDLLQHAKLFLNHWVA